ncbi:MAG: hypothetical protein GY833_23195 [Aestuariibacter sp.]|nr:hypothetical protein [Aestuariibacter sp.]|tara:strand:+ start:161634 stop:161822 length:189 start_codon:yes stop_codon:yes gene_type:complete
MSTEKTISGNIKFSESGLREENYFIQCPSMLVGLDTQFVTPDDLRVLADHLEALRAEKAKKD